MFEGLKKKANESLRDKHGIADLAAIATAIVTLVIVCAIGVYIANEVYNIASVTSGSAFYTASQKVPSLMSTSYSMLVIAVIAVIAGVIIAYLLGAFGGAGVGGAGAGKAK